MGNEREADFIPTKEELSKSFNIPQGLGEENLTRIDPVGGCWAWGCLKDVYGFI